LDVRTFTPANAFGFFSAFVIAASAGRVSRRCFFPSAFRAATISSRVHARAAFFTVSPSARFTGTRMLPDGHEGRDRVV
jgi:hypothetical protein